MPRAWGLPTDYDSIDTPEAHERGRAGFWHHAPIWANPFMGGLANAWRKGWYRGLDELQDALGGGKLLVKDWRDDVTWATELRRHRPADIEGPILTTRRQPGAKSGKTRSPWGHGKRAPGTLKAAQG